MPETTDGYPLADIEEPRPFHTEYDPFDYHLTSEECRTQLAYTRRCFKDLRDFVKDSVPSCRERSQALSHLQDALSSTIQAIVFTHPDSTPVVELAFTPEDAPGG